MPKKQSIATSAVAGAATARAAKSRTSSRPAAAKHSKAQTAEPVVEPVESAAVAHGIPDDRHQQIAKIAYEFWEARGYEHGYAHEDWIRAEAEYLRRSPDSVLS